MTCKIYATYKSTSIWELNFDLHSVADWYIEWDCLYVKFKDSDADYQCIDPTFSAEDDTETYKYPEETNIENNFG